MILTSPIKGDEYKRTGAYFEPLRVRALGAPNLTVRVSEGSYLLQNSELVEFSGGVSAPIQVPTQDAHWVAVCLNELANLVNIAGNTSTSPAQPTIPTGHMILALVYVQAGSTIVTDDMVFDARPLFRMGTGDIDHTTIINTGVADQHTIAAVTNLQGELDATVKIVDNVNLLAQKADLSGTPSPMFTLNNDFTGVTGEDCSLVVNRGSNADVAIRWNEVSEIWEFTNDGGIWAPLGGSGSAGLPLTGGTLTGPLVGTTATFDTAVHTADVTATGDIIATGDITAADITATGDITAGKFVGGALGLSTSVYADLTAITTAITAPLAGMIVFVAGQGLAVHDSGTWVKAADGSTPIT